MEVLLRIAGRAARPYSLPVQVSPLRKARRLLRLSLRTHSEYEHPKHPPDKEYRDDGSRDVNDPVARCFRFPKIEHAAMVAGPRAGARARRSCLRLMAKYPEIAEALKLTVVSLYT